MYDFYAYCRLGNNESSGRLFRPRLRLEAAVHPQRPTHEERGIIPLAVHHRTVMSDVCFALAPQLLPQRHESVQRRFLGYDGQAWIAAVCRRRPL
jgi:hypothetical protein